MNKYENEKQELKEILIDAACGVEAGSVYNLSMGVKFQTVTPFEIKLENIFKSGPDAVSNLGAYFDMNTRSEICEIATFAAKIDNREMLGLFNLANKNMIGFYNYSHDGYKIYTKPFDWKDNKITCIDIHMYEDSHACSDFHDGEYKFPRIVWTDYTNKQINQGFKEIGRNDYAFYKKMVPHLQRKIPGIVLPILRDKIRNN